MNFDSLPICVLEPLGDVGWHRDLNVDVDGVLSGLKSAGFSINDHAIEVLRVFYPFFIKPVIPEGWWIHVDPTNYSNWWDPNFLPFLESAVGEKCCMIGRCEGGDAFVTLSGRAVVLNDDWLFFDFTRTFPQLLEFQLCRNDELFTRVELPSQRRPKEYRDDG